nr:DNA helicase II [Gammaproteobacteria bacterium]
MDVSHLLDPLNEAQRDAVAAPPGPTLVLAGAGSGKTRVLTHRIAWLVETLDVSPLSVLAVTFTNKAAHEMRGRIENILGFSLRGMWIGTFHGICHRLLRAHPQAANLPETFVILDSDDQFRLVRRALRELNVDEGYWPVRQVQWFINNHKDEGHRAHHLPDTEDSQHDTLVRIFAHYETQCQQLGLVDFSELLLRAVEMLEKNDDLLCAYRQRFSHILVDEFQDTNTVQYRWLRLLAEPAKQIVAVGDDDQSIYGWRGARVENMSHFEHDFGPVKVVRLEQNYRSTGHILRAANAVIEHNTSRLGKKLWTAGSEGDKISVYAAFNEIDEGRFVIEQLQDWVGQGHRRDSAAVLYRSNAQSRVFEELLLDAGIPYRVYGGLRFFERAEIKDALAYLRLAYSHDSDTAFERIVNTPTRGVGARTLEAVRMTGRVEGLSLWKATVQLVQSDTLPKRARSALQNFLELINALVNQLTDLKLSEQVSVIISHSGLIDHYRKERGERAETRVENLEELVNAARHFSFDPIEHEGQDALGAFLSHAALEAGEGQAEEWEDCVQLMSLHMAKGLEFPVVFLTGLEENLFPHQRSLGESGQLEEERRLCYVGMTRAMQRLYLTWAEVRRLHGREYYTTASRFLSEIPEELITEVRAVTAYPTLSASSAMAANSGDNIMLGTTELRLGGAVRHAKFGDGTLVKVEGQGASARVQVNFEKEGNKWLVLAYASLQPL